MISKATSKTPRRRSYERKSGGPITPAEYSGLQKAFDHFNAELFGGALGDLFITYQRHANSKGILLPGSFLRPNRRARQAT